MYFSDYGVLRTGGLGKSDIWLCRRETRDSDWRDAVNLGAPVNTPHHEITPELSHNGRELYFESDRPGSRGIDDLWVATRPTRRESWREPIRLGPAINTDAWEHCPNITADGLTLYFDRTPEGEEIADLLMTRRVTPNSPWGQPTNLGHEYSTHAASSISADGTILYYTSGVEGGLGATDIWCIPVTVRASAAP